MLSELSDYLPGNGPILCHPRDKGEPNIIKPVPQASPGSCVSKVVLWLDGLISQLRATP